MLYRSGGMLACLNKYIQYKDTRKLLPNVVRVGCPEVTVPLNVHENAFLYFLPIFMKYVNFVSNLVNDSSTSGYRLYGNSK